MTESDKGDDFKLFVRKLTKNLTNLNDTYINLITDDIGMKQFKIAFTHKDQDAKCNYEMYEFIGDTIIKTTLTMYMYDKYPQLRDPRNVQFIGRSKIVAENKITFSAISKGLGFDKWIDIKPRVFQLQIENDKNVLEDVFESYIGCLSQQLRRIGESVVYVIIKDVLTNIFNLFPEITLNENSLWDKVSILKEILDRNKHLEKLKSDDNKNVVSKGYNQLKVYVLLIKDTIKDKIFKSVGEDIAIKVAKRKAASAMINILLGAGYSKSEHILYSSGEPC